jgi:Cu2+-exporting ATPase
MVVHMVQVESSNGKAVSRCQHCNGPLPLGKKSSLLAKNSTDTSDLAAFCCIGCETTWNLINGLGLAEFYSRLTKNPDAPDLTHTIFPDIFDLAEFQDGFVVPAEMPGWKRAFLSLDGISCYACSWLIQRAIKSRFSDSARAQINLSGSEVVLDYKPAETSLSSLVQLLTGLGFGVQPMRGQADRNRQRSQEAVRIGVAFFCFMNIMSLAFADYVTPKNQTMDPVFWHLFRIISLCLATVSVSYGAAPFWRGTLVALKQYRIVIDVPLLVGIVAAWCWSAFNVMRGQGPVYFDSIAAVVALVLAARFVQALLLDRLHRRLIKIEDTSVDFVRKKVSDGSFMMTGLANVMTGDRLRMYPGDVFCVRTRLDENSVDAQVSLEQLKGEVEWIDISSGDEVPSGAINGNVMVDGVALESGAAAYVYQSGRIVERLIQEKGRLSLASDRLASGFFFSLMVVAGVVLAVSPWFPQISFEDSIGRAVALILIACPCAFGIAVPLVMGRAFHLALERGIVFKSQRAIEGLAASTFWFFDKTGTLTLGRLNVTRAEVLNQNLVLPHLAAFKRACHFSSHHVPDSILRWMNENFPGVESVDESDLVRFSESRGLGITAKFRDFEVDLWKASNPDWSSVWSVDGIPVMRFAFEDSLDPDATDVISAIKAGGISCGILSGDKKINVDRFANHFPNAWNLVASGATPQEKMSEITRSVESSRYPVVMIGNGVNDALALAGAAVGVAVCSASQAARRSADVVLINPKLRTILDARSISISAQRAVVRCFYFSISYNLIGGVMAVLGYLTPVVAAVVMPLSSLTITAIASRWSVVKQS